MLKDVDFKYKSGALTTTKSVNLSGSGANLGVGGFVTLSPQAAPSYAAGKLVYDSDNECVTFYNNEADVALQVGQEAWIRVRNSSGSTITNGSAVYVNGNHPGTGLPTIALAQANSATTTLVAGLATHDIENNTIGYVTSLGTVRGLDTSSFSNGASLYLSASAAGTLTATAPSSPNYRFRVGLVTKAAAGTAGLIHVTPSTGALANGASGTVLGINAAGSQAFKTVTGSGGVAVTSSDSDIGVAALNVAPTDVGFKAWTYDSAFNAAAQSLTDGTLYLCGLYVRASITVTTIWFGVSVVGVTPVSGQCLAGIYSSAGTLLNSGSTETAITTTGLRSATIASTSLTPGMYWVGFLQNTTGTSPSLIHSAATGATMDTVPSGNTSGATLRFATNGTSLTALPSPLTPANNVTTNSRPLWFAVS